MKQEEIQKYTDELAQQYFPNEHNILARENIVVQFVAEACVRMAKHIEHGLIEKACAWLEQREGDYDLYDAWSGDYVSFKSVIMDFRKVMEE